MLCVSLSCEASWIEKLEDEIKKNVEILKKPRSNLREHGFQLKFC